MAKVLLFLSTLLALNIFAYAQTQITDEHLNQLKSAEGKNLENKNNWILLYFWASWCPDCKAKLKGPLKEDPKIAGLTFATVNTDKDEAYAKDFILREKLTTPIAFDSNKEVRKILKVFSVPRWFLLQKNDNQWSVVQSGTDLELNKIKEVIK